MITNQARELLALEYFDDPVLAKKIAEGSSSNGDVPRAVHAIEKLLVQQIVAPWPDYAGKPIRHGDRLQHPDGTTFVTIRINGQDDEFNAWRCVYDGADILVTTSRLCLQIGDKGQAVVV